MHINILLRVDLNFALKVEAVTFKLFKVFRSWKK